MKILTISLIFISLSCTPQANNDSKDFDELSLLFDSTELPILFDSSFFVKSSSIIKTSQSIDSKFFNSIGVQNLLETYEDSPKFVLYPLYKIVGENRIGLFYLSTLNPKIPFDGTVKEVNLIIYDKQGKVIDNKKVALIDSRFGEEKRIYSLIDKDLNIFSEHIEIKENLDNGKITRSSQKKSDYVKL